MRRNTNGEHTLEDLLQKALHRLKERQQSLRWGVPMPSMPLPVFVVTGVALLLACICTNLVFAEVPEAVPDHPKAGFVTEGQKYGLKDRLLKRVVEEDTEPNIRLGPLRLQGQSFFQVLRLNMAPWCEKPLKKGEFQLQTTTTWVNLWAWKPDRYLVDGEVLRVAVAVCYGITDRIQLRFEVPATLRTGGIMDPVVEKFHEALGLFNSYKEAFPRNRFRVVFRPPEGGEYRLDARDTGIALSDLLLSAKMHLYKGTRFLPAVLVGANLKIPTGINEGGGVDVGGNLYLAKRLWLFYAYFGVQYTHYSREEILGIPLSQEQWSYLVALEVPFTKRFSLLVQEFINTRVAKNFYQFSDATYEVTLGVKYRLKERTVLEFGLLENLVNYDNSPDFGFHFGITHRFH